MGEITEALEAAAKRHGEAVEAVEAAKKKAESAGNKADKKEAAKELEAAEKEAAAALENLEAAEKAEAEAEAEPPYSVAPGVSVTSKKGIIGPGEEVTADHFPGGQKRLDELVKAGTVKKRGQ